MALLHNDRAALLTLKFTLSKISVFTLSKFSRGGGG